jgi:hypothetical protein
MVGRRTLRERTPSGSPHKKITSGQVYEQPVLGTVGGQDGTWPNLYVWAVTQFRERPHIIDSGGDEMPMQMMRRNLGEGSLPVKWNWWQLWRVARIRR